MKEVLCGGRVVGEIGVGLCIKNSNSRRTL